MKNYKFIIGRRGLEARYAGTTDDSNHGSDLATGRAGPAHCQLQMHLNRKRQRYIKNQQLLSLGVNRFSSYLTSLLSVFNVQKYL